MTQTDDLAGRDRQALIDEVLAEMTSWNPREQMGAFKMWLRGALSLVHLHALAILEAEGPLPMSRLADALDVSVASATGIVARMEHRGLVERRHADDDRRVVVVNPTEAGAAVFLDLAARRRVGLGKVLERIDDEDLRCLLVGMRALHRARTEAGHGADETPEGASPSADPSTAPPVVETPG